MEPRRRKTDTAWAGWPELSAGVRVRLFCLPYGGGGASVFSNWQVALPAEVGVCPVHLPGREDRIRDSCYTDVRTLVAVIGPELAPFLDRPFALFGHSMGALISFELSRYFRNTYGIAPAHLFVSGYPGPRWIDPEPRWYDLPDGGFVERLKRLDGTPPGVLEHPELRELMLPILRSDVKLVQTYTYSQDRLLDIPITAFAGREDVETPLEAVDRWREETTSRFSIHTIPGGHFFLVRERSVFLKQLSHDLIQLASSLLNR
jgi:medium-chain acyl-[acyl-carrier-protein] hydrolase